MEPQNHSVDDFSLNVFSVAPYQPNRTDVHVSDGDKAGATLLFSGVFLGLVGITFTVMGWIKYEGIALFEWTQLLGPILLSVGVTFVLIAVCRFRMLTCRFCKQSDERALDIDQTPSGQSFVFTGINQPITFHGATVVQYIPPPYPFQEAMAENSVCLPPKLNPSRNVPLKGPTTTNSFPPQYYTIFPMDNSSFVDEEFPDGQNEGSNDRSEEKAEEPEELLEAENCENSPPPPYEEIFQVLQ
ncbi:transmembrane protein 174 [Rhinatrema bivittatum]|uniref:transmembrane protein 174 n=1 Tax=Rhinatrema bivittatum TaxID=194408 RepID=UPI001126A378|nr:transmembrane protein 174 [Rhinatrema bivittatum]